MKLVKVQFLEWIAATHEKPKLSKLEQVVVTLSKCDRIFGKPPCSVWSAVYNYVWEEHQSRFCVFFLHVEVWEAIKRDLVAVSEGCFNIVGDLRWLVYCTAGIWWKQIQIRFETWRVCWVQSFIVVSGIETLQKYRKICFSRSNVAEIIFSNFPAERLFLWKIFQTKIVHRLPKKIWNIVWNLILNIYALISRMLFVFLYHAHIF